VTLMRDDTVGEMGHIEPRMLAALTGRLGVRR
jgi:hypothetical protein